MEVKCPRCRYRFDMHKSPGVTTLQCFCPRCGQPFSYDIDTPPASGDGYPKSGTPTSDVGKSSSVISPGHHGATRARGEATGDEDDVTIGRKEKKEPMRVHWQGAFMGESRGGLHPRRATAMPPTEKKHGCLHRLAVGVLCCVAVAFLTVRYCHSEKRYTVHDVNVSDGTRQQGEQNPVDDIQDDEQTADTVVAEQSAAEEEIPHWVEGTWHADTEYGGIDVTINGNTITETAGDETSRGTFRYRNNTLYCDFGDGETFEYRIDSDRQRIDAGCGIYMSKTC